MDTLFPYTTLFRAHRLRIGAGDAGYHRVAEPQFQQQRAEDIAVAVDHALAVAAQIAAALEALIEHLDHLGHVRRIDAVVDLEALCIGDAHIAQLVVPPLAPDEHRDAIARSEEHTSELQSLMRISYAVLRLKNHNFQHIHTTEA